MTFFYLSGLDGGGCARVELDSRIGLCLDVELHGAEMETLAKNIPGGLAQVAVSRCGRHLCCCQIFLTRGLNLQL